MEDAIGNTNLEFVRKIDHVANTFVEVGGALNFIWDQLQGCLGIMQTQLRQLGNNTSDFIEKSYKANLEIIEEAITKLYKALKEQFENVKRVHDEHRGAILQIF